MQLSEILNTPISSVKFSFNNPRPRILVTGAQGRLASVVIPALEPHYELHLTDIKPAQPGQKNYTQADITKFAEAVPLMEGMDGFVHLAIATRRELSEEMLPDRLNQFEETMLNVNVQGTYHLFEAARRAGVKRAIYLSSLTAYLGERHRPYYGKETPLAPRDLYACTKIFGENVGEIFHRLHGMSVLSLRIGQPYPVGIKELDDAWVHSKRARSAFITLEDVAHAVTCALQSEVLYGIYNLVSASDNPRYDLKHAKEIGFVPRGYFSDAGLQFYPEGNYPEFTGEVVTH